MSVEHMFQDIVCRIHLKKQQLLFLKEGGNGYWSTINIVIQFMHLLE
jgi:hypothetical protein